MSSSDSLLLRHLKRLNGSDQLAQTLTAFVMSVLTQQRRRLDAESVTEPPLRQIIDVLQQVMRAHNAEKLAISVVGIYKAFCNVVADTGFPQFPQNLSS